MRKIVIVTIMIMGMCLACCAKAPDYSDTEAMKRALEAEGYTVTKDEGLESADLASDGEEDTGLSEAIEESKRKYQDIDNIWLLTNVNEENIPKALVDTDQKLYYLVLNSKTAKFTYHPGKDEEILMDRSAEYDISVFNNIEQLIRKNPIEEYHLQSDENGKMIYGVAEYALYISYSDENGKPHIDYINTPPNIDEIVEEFEKLKENTSVEYGS